MIADIATPNSNLLGRFKGCLVGVAVGDALGAPFEGHPSVSSEDWTAVADGTAPLRFTDDTHMTFGVIETLLGTEGLDGQHLSSIFIRDYDAEPWRGYGPGPPEIFAKIKAGAKWHDPARQLYDGQGSFGNGAAMRAAPIGLRYFHDPDMAADLARKTALITHAHALGQDGAVAQAVAIAYVIAADHPLDADQLVARVTDQLETPAMKNAIERAATVAGSAPSEVAAAVGNGVPAVEAVPAAMSAFLSNLASFSDAVEFAVRIGGDTDTIASMTGALAGAHLGVEVIPAGWRERAEGARSMARLAGHLLDHAMQDVTAIAVEPY